MKIHYYLALSFSLIFGVLMQTTSAAAIQKTTKAVQPIIAVEKMSPIEKALSQQKRDRSENKVATDADQMKMITSLNNAPTQNFLAEQHQRFSRFVQALFQQHTS